jgi:hypothetical protein
MVGIPKPNQKSKGKNQKSKIGRAGRASHGTAAAQASLIFDF